MSQTTFLTGLINAVYRDSRFRLSDFEKLQQHKLQKLISHAKTRVLFQQDRLTNVDPQSPNLHLVEPTAKTQMMQAFEETIADQAISWSDVRQIEGRPESELPIIDKKFLVSRTSGTNGETGCFVHDLPAWNRLRAVSLTRTMRGRLSPFNLARFSFGRRCRMAFLITDCGYSTSRHAGFSPMRIGQLYTDVRLFPVTDPLQETIAKLNAFQPHYVHSYPSVFELIAQQKLADESITFAPELLSFSSESLLPGAEKTIRTAFPKAISRSIYATTECLPIAHACEHGNLHLNMDVCIVEPIARDGSPCTPGDFSDHVLLTSLENFCQPIIRYRLDDSIRFVPEKCLCNRPLPMIQVQGRTDDIFVLRNERGVEVEVPPVPLTFALHKINGLSQFQIIQDTHRLIRVNFVVRSINESEAVAAKIKDRLQESIAKYGKFASVSIKTVVVDSIERTGSGQKLRQIVSNVKRS